MKNLQMPHSYASLSEDEQMQVSGGGPLRDALDAFFGSLHLDDLFWEGGLISFSFTFVPMLLFKAGFGFAMDIYDRFSNRFSFSQEGTDLMQFLSARYKEEQDQTPTV